MLKVIGISGVLAVAILGATSLAHAEPTLPGQVPSNGRTAAAATDTASVSAPEAQSVNSTAKGQRSTTDSANVETGTQRNEKSVNESPQATQAESGTTQEDSSPDAQATSLNPSEDKDSSEDSAKEPVWSNSPKVRVGGYVYSAFYLTDRSGSPSNEFHLRNARVQLAWNQGTLLDGEVEAELSKDGDDIETVFAPLRDAYVRVSPFRALRLRMGQFKRPFGRLSLMSHRELRLVKRGISDAWFDSALDYAGRDVGAQIEGRIGKRYELEYAVAVVNGTGPNDRESDAKGAKDVVGRVVQHLGKHFEVAANVSSRHWDNPPATRSYAKSAWMWGGDVALDYRGFFAMLEGGYGDNYTTMDHDKSWYVLALLAHKIPITETWNLAVEPLVKGEMLTYRVNESGASAVSGTVGANLHVAKIFRLMVQGEWTHPADESLLPEKLGEAKSMKRLIVQAALHTK